MLNVIKFFIVFIFAVSLSGCLVAAAGAGAGGMYTADHYKVTKKNTDSSS